MTIRRPNARGFTLIELMIAILVVSILASIAFSMYGTAVQKSRRVEARTALLDLAGREEKVMSMTNAYSATPTDLGYTGTAFPITVGSGYYSLNATVCNPPTSTCATGATYTLTATAINQQTSDTNCATFTLTQTGAQTAANASSGNTSDTCWK